MKTPFCPLHAPCGYLYYLKALQNKLIPSASEGRRTLTFGVLPWAPGPEFPENGRGLRWQVPHLTQRDFYTSPVDGRKGHKKRSPINPGDMLKWEFLKLRVGLWHPEKNKNLP